jgi:hypothetical protein
MRLLRRPNGVDTVSRNDFQLERAMRAAGERACEALWRCGIAN